MKTKIQIEEDIINITAKINDEYPELSKYVSEMPANNAENAEVNIKNLENYYNSLKDVLKQYSKTHDENVTQKNNDTVAYADLQIYPPSEDIYQQFKEETDLNPEDITKKKTPNEIEGSLNEKSFSDTMSGSDLDIPGSELDDQQESVGSEDEENNYYSLGGDDHNDLDEDK